LQFELQLQGSCQIAPVRIRALDEMNFRPRHPLDAFLSLGCGHRLVVLVEVDKPLNAARRRNRFDVVRK
jgi:hypothetical protein